MIAAWVAVFIISLVVLIKSADYFTLGAEKLGLHFKIPAFIIGITIVSIGTSLPELGSAIFAVFSGSSEIVAGTVIGSNISNILLVFGASVLLAKKKVSIKKELSK